MQLRWQKIYEDRKHASQSAFSRFSFDPQGRILDWSFDEVGVSPKVSAGLEVAITWHLNSQKNFFNVDPRELESYLRDYNHEPLFSDLELQELQENIENMKATCVNSLIGSFFKTEFQKFDLVEKTRITQDFLQTAKKLFHLNKDELRLIDIHKGVIFIQAQNSSFGVFLQEFSKKVDLFVSFVAHQGNLS